MLDFVKDDDSLDETAKTMTAKEVAELFGKTVTTIYAWRDKGIIHPIYSSPSHRGEEYARSEIYKLYNSGFRRA